MITDMSMIIHSVFEIKLLSCVFPGSPWDPMYGDMYYLVHGFVSQYMGPHVW